MTSTHYSSHSPISAISLMDTAEQVFDQAKYELSIQYYTQAIAQINAPANLAYALYMRGCAYKEIGNKDKARQDWESAQKLGFQHPWGINLIAQALND
ncbi:hypothetical protein [Microscilla marina]|nr:hypothetical protein [Microscilla marina]